MNKHTEALKLLVVKEYLEGTIGYVTLGHKHGLDPSMIKRWVARYRLHGIKGISKKFTRYSAEFKLSVLMHLWDNDLSYRQASAYFNIRSPGVLPQWVRFYREVDLMLYNHEKKKESLECPIKRLNRQSIKQL
jgi:transposase